MRIILGLSAYYHDAAAALVSDGRIVAAAQEERFTRRKHDERFPENAARFCLEQAGVRLRDIDAVVFYDKPFLKFERLLETYLANAPRGLRSFVAAMPVWLKEKLFLKAELRRQLDLLCGPWGEPPPLLFSEHHLSHAASAFYPSPFETAAVLCLDGVGEWATTSAWVGSGNQLQALWEQHFPHSLGLLYSAFTYYTGFKVNSGEYKMMGLAPYGTPRYAQAIRDNLVDIKPDGTFRLDMQYFDYATGLRMTTPGFDALFDGRPARMPEATIDQRTMDLAASIQQVTDEIVLALARTLRSETGQRQLCLAGGVALNCVSNGLLARHRIFDEIWIQPAAGDAGGALGAALVGWHGENPGVPRRIQLPDAMSGAFLGPDCSDEAAIAFVERHALPHVALTEPGLIERVARLLAEGAVVGWAQGRMEFGPRALGNRSILADPRRPEMQRELNLKIKFRESFRPFAPSVPADRAADFFALEVPSPYMLLVAPVRPAGASREAGTAATDQPDAASTCAGGDSSLPTSVTNIDPAPWSMAVEAAGFERLQHVDSPLPAITHVDQSARVQTVSAGQNPRFHSLLEAFGARTGVPVLINTSFNVRGEPIVCTPEDAYRCFMATAIDYLVMGTCVLDRREQPAQHALLQASRSFIPD